MASIGHVVVGLGAARLHRQGRHTQGSLVATMVAWVGLSMLPDADVIGFRVGVRYADAWGHRGATHSLLLALIVGSALGLLAPRFGLSRARMWLLVVAVTVSHTLLDTLTDGGLGCALFWPFDQHRYFAPWRPIPVAPIGRAFYTEAGWRVATTELVMFLPVLIYAIWPRRSAPAE